MIRGRPFGLLARGLLAGLLAALLMTVAMLLLRLFAGVPLPAELIGDRFLPLLPVDLFLDMLTMLGGPIMAKQLAFFSGFANAVALGAILGLGYSFVVERQGGDAGFVRRSVLIVAPGVLALWFLTVAVLWPVLDSSYVGLPPGWALVASLAGFLVFYTLYGTTLVVAYAATRSEIR